MPLRMVSKWVVSGVMHALKNGFKVAFDIKEFWDGERFCEFKNLFLVC